MTTMISVDQSLLLTKVHGHTLFSLFKDNIEIGRIIKKILESDKLDNSKDVDQRDIDNPLRKKVSLMLSSDEPIEFSSIKTLESLYENEYLPEHANYILL